MNGMNAHPHDHDGQAGRVYVLHFEPAYRHARDYVGWAHDVDARLAEHLAGAGSPLVRAAIAASVQVELAITIAGSRRLEWRLKRWHKTGQFCPTCRAARGGRAR
jgi:predicted GIY-YIG superfamily endonuclease